MRDAIRGAGGLAAALLGAAACAAAIPTDDLEPSWPRQQVREFEVGRSPVRWRQKADKRQGLFAGVRFTVPRDRQLVWTLSNDYSDIGAITPGVEAVREVNEGLNRKIIEVDLKVLWKSLTLRFEVEEEPPRTVRFRWADGRFGEYRGVAVFEETGQGATTVELSTRFQPNRPVPMRLLLGVERVAMLSATKEFLRACEAAPAR